MVPQESEAVTADQNRDRKRAGTKVAARTCVILELRINVVLGHNLSIYKPTCKEGSAAASPRPIAARDAKRNGRPSTAA